MNAMNLTQTMRQEQRLSLQQAQAIKALQLPALALRQFIKNELDTNPFLEADYSDNPEISIDAERENFQEVSAEDSSNSSDFSTSLDEDSGLANLDSEDIDYLYSDGNNNEYNPDLEERRQFAYDSIPTRETLYDDLFKQLDFIPLAPDRRALAEVIVGSLDTSGYLSTPLAEIAQAVPNATIADAQDALAAVQSLEPAGIGARGLIECLLLQLVRQGLADTLAADILRGDPALIERRDFVRIAEVQRVTVPEVKFALAELARLNPAPGANVAPAETQYVESEFSVFKNPATGHWDATLVSSSDLNIPNLKIAEYKTQTETKEERDWFARKKIEARAIVYAVEERRRTLLLVARETVARQQAFFETGARTDIAPLTMTQVADAVGINESTVTRAVAGKYGHWPRGVFEMRSLFTTGGVTTSDGGALTDTAVKEKIKALIAEEDKSTPLADQDIAEILIKGGVAISRRTVAKYREALRIPSSRERKV
ncbi:MAG: RNA polymerase factor sigma-54 [Kiritimatiellaeota bacterium]|nr:RNA polymerase factor sigma-54 [Kiritimatiellota bacterium]